MHCTFAFEAEAQEKGASPLSTQNASLETQSYTTRAVVVVGISNYQNDDIPDLRFVDKDAEAFAKYLQSPSGGNVSDENIRLLTNSDATMAAIASELDWLVEESEEGGQSSDLLFWTRRCGSPNSQATGLFVDLRFATKNLYCRSLSTVLFAIDNRDTFDR